MILASTNINAYAYELLSDAYDEEATIEYIPEENGYYLKNITAQEVFSAFEANENFKKISTKQTREASNVQETDFYLRSQRALENKGINIQSTRAAIYTEEYALTTSMLGLFNDNVHINYTIVMNMTTVFAAGKEYAMFVDVRLGPSYWLKSGIYTFTDSGTTAPRLDVANGGATINVQQIIQLETIVEVAASAALNTKWFSFEISASGNYYFRSPSKSIQQAIDFRYMMLSYSGIFRRGD